MAAMVGKRNVLLFIEGAGQDLKEYVFNLVSLGKGGVRLWSAQDANPNIQWFDPDSSNLVLFRGVPSDPQGGVRVEGLLTTDIKRRPIGISPWLKSGGSDAYFLVEAAGVDHTISVKDGASATANSASVGRTAGGSLEASGQILGVGAKATGNLSRTDTGPTSSAGRTTETTDSYTIRVVTGLKVTAKAGIPQVSMILPTNVPAYA